MTSEFRRLVALVRNLRVEGRILLAFLGVALLGFAFLKLASEMVEGETLAFDRHMLRALRSAADPSLPIGPGWLHAAMLDITALGGSYVLMLLTLFTLGFLLVARKFATALFVALSVSGGAALALFLKAIFERPRPDIVAHLIAVDTASFPSGHAANSAIVYLTLGALLARTQQSRAVRIYLIAVAILLAVAVGVSRVYLGVHWPSDVAAGWCVGGAWAVLCWLVARLLQSRRQIEPPDPDPAPGS